MSAKYDLKNEKLRCFTEWKDMEIPSTKKYIYIKDLLIPALSMKFTYYKDSEKKKDSTFFVDTMVKALGIVLSNLEEAPINLKGLILKDIFDTDIGVMNKLFEYHKQGYFKKF